MKTEQLVLVRSLFIDESGEKKYSLGTGYFIAANLVLTANHVVPADTNRIEVRIEESKKWITADNVPCWKDLTLDAALLVVNEPIENVTIDWHLPNDEDVELWSSLAY